MGCPGSDERTSWRPKVLFSNGCTVWPNWSLRRFWINLAVLKISLQKHVRILKTVTVGQKRLCDHFGLVVSQTTLYNPLKISWLLETNCWNATLSDTEAAYPKPNCPTDWSPKRYRKQICASSTAIAPNSKSSKTRCPAKESHRKDTFQPQMEWLYESSRLERQRKFKSW